MVLGYSKAKLSLTSMISSFVVIKGVAVNSRADKTQLGVVESM
jgi:hypothetical protein